LSNASAVKQGAAKTVYRLLDALIDRQPRHGRPRRRDL
jgi:hypothetical protein